MDRTLEDLEVLALAKQEDLYWHEDLESCEGFDSEEDSDWDTASMVCENGQESTPIEGEAVPQWRSMQEHDWNAKTCFKLTLRWDLESGRSCTVDGFIRARQRIYTTSSVPVPSTIPNMDHA